MHIDHVRCFYFKENEVSSADKKLPDVCFTKLFSTTQEPSPKAVLCTCSAYKLYCIIKIGSTHIFIMESIQFRQSRTIFSWFF